MSADLALVYDDARRVARQQRALGFDVDASDYWTDGWLGLRSARRRFDQARGVRFQTFANHHIRGAIIGGMRIDRPAGRSTKHPVFRTPSPQQPDPRALSAPSLLLRCLVDRCLTRREREAIVRHYWYGERGWETARHLQLSKARTDAIIRGARAKLRDAWAAAV